MSKYDTTGGIPTRDGAYTKLMWHLSEAADQAAVLSHIYNTEDSDLDKLIAKGWLGVHHLLMMVIEKIRNLAATKFQ